MTGRLVAALLVLSALQAADKQSFEVSRKEVVSFPPGGTIHLNNSYGYLTVEGWDSPAVEITIAKSTDRYYEPDRKDMTEKRFDRVQVSTERRSDKELAISTALPVRNRMLRSVLPSDRMIVTMPVHSKGGITVEYTVHVPRDSRLVIQHDNGYVWVSDVTGDIEVRSHTGDMIVMLPDPGPYVIDAGTRIGSITSDFSGRKTFEFLLGTHFAYAGPAPSRRVYLRMGRGSITLKNGPPSGPFWKD